MQNQADKVSLILLEPMVAKSPFVSRLGKELLNIFFDSLGYSIVERTFECCFADCAFGNFLGTDLAEIRLALKRFLDHFSEKSQIYLLAFVDSCHDFQTSDIGKRDQKLIVFIEEIIELELMILSRRSPLLRLANP